jgi:fluoroquinolone resistance protein
MDRTYTENRQFDKTDFAEEPLPFGDYENCTFVNGNFSNANLSGFRFTDCSFAGCNLGMAGIKDTAFRNVAFKDCKLLGLRFGDCNNLLFAVRFEDCMLNSASFYKRKMKGTVFQHCRLQDADFTDADLTQAVFHECELLRAIFENTTLEKADLYRAYDYLIDPLQNKIKRARFATAGVAGLLQKFDILIE